MDIDKNLQFSTTSHYNLKNFRVPLSCVLCVGRVELVSPQGLSSQLQVWKVLQQSEVFRKSWFLMIFRSFFDDFDACIFDDFVCIFDDIWGISVKICKSHQHRTNIWKTSEFRPEKTRSITSGGRQRLAENPVRAPYFKIGGFKNNLANLKNDDFSSTLPTGAVQLQIPTPL